MVAPPKVTTQWDKAAHRLSVKVVFPDGSEPQENTLWWSVNRHPDYSIADGVRCVELRAMQKAGTATYNGEMILEGDAKTLDVITVHAHTENGSTLTLSSYEIRLE
jgi:hypothetical protein